MQVIEDNNCKNGGMVFGVRQLDFFFFPKFRILEEGLEIYRKGVFVPWNQIKKIQQFDNTFWRLMRRPLGPGTYVWYNENKKFWISTRIIREDRSFRQRISGWFTYQAESEDYLWLLSELRRRSQIGQAETRLEAVMDLTAVAFRSLAIMLTIILMIWLLLRLLRLS